MATTAGKGAAVYLATFPSLALTVPEPTTNLGADLTNYQVTASSHRYLDPAAVTTLESSTGGSWSAVVNSGTTAYNIQWAGGIVRFLVAQPASTAIRFSLGKYFVMAAAGNAREWQLNAATDLVDVSVFGLAAKTFLPVLHNHSGSFKQFWIDTSLYTNLMQLTMLQLYVNGAGTTRFEGYGSIKSDAITAQVNGVIEENVPFQFSGDVYLVP